MRRFGPGDGGAHKSLISPFEPRRIGGTIEIPGGLITVPLLRSVFWRDGDLKEIVGGWITAVPGRRIS
jgi:hypothetical protein